MLVDIYKVRQRLEERVFIEDGGAVTAPYDHFASGPNGGGKRARRRNVGCRHGGPGLCRAVVAGAGVEKGAAASETATAPHDHFAPTPDDQLIQPVDWPARHDW